jgi:hypothetical protein
MWIAGIRAQAMDVKESGIQWPATRKKKKTKEERVWIRVEGVLVSYPDGS